METGVEHRWGFGKIGFVTVRFPTFGGWNGKLLKRTVPENASSAITT